MITKRNCKRLIMTKLGKVNVIKGFGAAFIYFIVSNKRKKRNDLWIGRVRNSIFKTLKISVTKINLICYASHFMPFLIQSPILSF